MGQIQPIFWHNCAFVWRIDAGEEFCDVSDIFLWNLIYFESESWSTTYLYCYPWLVYPIFYAKKQWVHMEEDKLSDSDWHSLPNFLVCFRGYSLWHRGIVAKSGDAWEISWMRLKLPAKIRNLLPTHISLQSDEYCLVRDKLLLISRAFRGWRQTCSNVSSTRQTCIVHDYTARSIESS